MDTATAIRIAAGVLFVVVVALLIMRRNKKSV